MSSNVPPKGNVNADRKWRYLLLGKMKALWFREGSTYTSANKSGNKCPFWWFFQFILDFYLCLICPLYDTQKSWTFRTHKRMSSEQNYRIIPWPVLYYQQRALVWVKKETKNSSCDVLTVAAVWPVSHVPVQQPRRTEPLNHLLPQTKSQTK